MKQRWFAILCVALLPCLLGVSCAGSDKFRGGGNMLGIVQLGPFPKQSAAIGGYNLYLSETKDGPFDKINTEPVLGGSRLMVPYLKPGQVYYFRMTSVAAKDPSRESAPGQVFQRTAAEKAD
jgi:hypothetical protein